MERGTSRPVWGAWIEINRLSCALALPPSRAPYGARGLKSDRRNRSRLLGGRRAPYGARGLKSRQTCIRRHTLGVAPRMGRVD